MTSYLNKTTEPLLAGTGEFLGQPEDVGKYHSITVSCKTDQNTTLTTQFSHDGTNWDVEDVFSVDADVGFFRQLHVKGQFFRIKLNNYEVTNQTYMRCFCYFKHGTPNEIDVNLDSSQDNVEVFQSDENNLKALSVLELGGSLVSSSNRLPVDIGTGTQTHWQILELANPSSSSGASMTGVKILKVHIFNTNATNSYWLRLYDRTSNPTTADGVDLQFFAPANQTTVIDNINVDFSTGLRIAVADNNDFSSHTKTGTGIGAIVYWS